MALPGMLPITSLLVGAVATWGGGATGAREGFALGGAGLILTAGVGWRSLADRGVHDRAPADLTADAYIEVTATAEVTAAA
jgi:hypothetical protein